MGAERWRAGSRKMRQWVRLLGGFLACLVLILQGSLVGTQPLEASDEVPAQPVPTNLVEMNDRTLLVGLHPVPPFVIQSKNSEGGSDWDGIGVHLWREVAYKLNLDYQWRELNPNQAIAQLAAGKLDVALVTATASREQTVDFTQSYFATTLGVVTQRQQRVWHVVKAVLSPQFLRICLWLSLLLLVVGLICWLFERRSNAEMFNKSPWKGIWDGFWWAGVTMTTIGYGDKAPKSIGGRILALLWMLVAMGLTASLTASITSVLVLDQGIQPLQIQQLKTMQVGSIADAIAANYLRQEQIQFQPFTTPEAGMKAVDAGRIDAFVYGTTSLRTLNQDEFEKRLRVKDTGIQISQYTFALPENSQLREALNRQILRELSEPDWQSMLERYLPDSM